MGGLVSTYLPLEDWKKWLAQQCHKTNLEVLASVFHLFNLSAALNGVAQSQLSHWMLWSCTLWPPVPCDFSSEITGCTRGLLRMWDAPQGSCLCPPLFSGSESFSLEDPHLSPHLWPSRICLQLWLLPSAPWTRPAQHPALNRWCCTPGKQPTLSGTWYLPHWPGFSWFCPFSHPFIHLPHEVLCYLWLFLCWVPGICQTFFMLLLK